MSDSFSRRALSAIRRSDRKAAQLLGVTITRDPSAHTPHNRNDTRRKRFPFRLCLGNKHATAPCPPDANRPAPTDEVPSWDDAQSEDDPFVWDVPNPFVFVPLDPANAPLHDLIQAKVARARRYESVGPLQPVYHDVNSEDEDDEYDSDQDDEGYDSEDEDDSHGDDADDEDEDEDNDDDLEDVDQPNVIALPQLLHKVPLCFIAPSLPLPPPPPPTPLFYSSSEFEDEDLDQEDTPATWAEQAYNDVAEAEERIARKAKRDAHRSRSKVLAILGPEASSAL